MMDLPQFDKRIMGYFHVKNGRKYVDHVLWMATRNVTVDVMALDELLHERHGDYEDDGSSMADIITKEYGEEACDFVQNNI